MKKLTVITAIILSLLLINWKIQAANPGDVVINELMWMGSTGSTADEWIELRNMTDSPIDLAGWNITRLSSGSETLMLEIPSGIIAAKGYFLISNYDADHSNSRLNVIPDIVNTGVSLDNSQLQIKIYDGTWNTGTNLIDTADDGSGAPLAGDNTNKYSMMRNDPPGDGTQASNWFTADIAVGWDASATEKGTPGSANFIVALPLDHFAIDNISNQRVGVAFAITVTAKDVNDNTATNFTSTVNISDLTGTITPTFSGSFSSGVWTGSVTIAQAWSNDVITVTNSTGSETGSSNTFNAVAGPGPGDVVINELMWMGSSISSADEWIELRNMTNNPVNLAGWQLTRKSSSNEVFMLEIPSGIIPANGYFLISNYNESSSKIAVIPELVDADVSLANTQLQIKLYDSQWDGGGILIDVADDGTSDPAAGDNANKYSMMRTDPPGDGMQASNWFTATIARGWDAGATELGTPGSSNYDYDFGDAPDPLVTKAGQYPTLLANNGARHLITTELYLGSSIDADDNGQPSAAANGDDIDTQGNDEDGVDPVQLNLRIGDTPNIIVAVVNTTGSQATIKGWIDYNGDGIFAMAESATNTASSSGIVTLIFPPVPITATASTFARFRISTDETSISQPDGQSPDGEVEDYSVTINTDSDDDGIPDSIEGTGDRDGDGIPDNEDYDPSGWIYDEANGNIIIGGNISVSPSTGVNIIHDGSNGYYQFTVSTSGDYTLSYIPPSGFTLSSTCNAQSTRLDIAPTDRNPYDVGKGSKDGTTDKMTNYACGDNPYYWDFYLDLGDPVIINNNIPLNLQPTNIKLSTFSAAVENNGVVISWQTESEPNNAGFNIYRSQQEKGDCIKINSTMIPAQGDAATGHSYSYTDRPEQAGTYFYKLEDIAIDGQTTFHGPIEVTGVTSIAINQMAIPDQFELSQNYPNPFNPETHIQFALPKDEQVRISIYDLQGHLVRTLVNDRKAAGTYSVIWDSRDEAGVNAASGVYFYRINAGEFTMTKKMILMK